MQLTYLHSFSHCDRDIHLNVASPAVQWGCQHSRWPKITGKKAPGRLLIAA